jgi:putative PIN family toxin of toxin-antitoxin system
MLWGGLRSLECDHVSEEVEGMYVFDSNIFVAALRSRRGASFLILSAIRQQILFGAISEALFLEYCDVLKRDNNLQNFWTDLDEVDIILGVLADVLEPVPIYFQWRPQLRDPKDEMVLECAINAQARAIVTFNTQDFLPAAAQFGIEIVQPGELVRSLNLVERLSR